MPTLSILGIEVEFPFIPYQLQIDYMTKVIESLQTKKHALLESPTGTGKTLCLLCASLAWRRNELKKYSPAIEEVPDENSGSNLPFGWGNVGGEDTQQSRGPSLPKIIYSSRTHSQLTQAVAELKNTAYAKDVKISVLGSRDQLCVHPEVSKQTNNTAKVHMCRNKVNKHMCHFYNNIENVKSGEGIISKDDVMDIEDLVNLGKKRNICPYYYSRELSKEPDCDIIFTPYNYLIDKKMRKSNKLDIEGNFLIFDEAHNVEKVCEESASFEISSLDLAQCVKEVGDLLNAVKKVKDTGVLPEGHEAGETASLGEFDEEALAVLKVLFVTLEKELDKYVLGSDGFTKNGDFIFEFFEKVNLTFNTFEAIVDILDRITSYLSTLSNQFQIRGVGLQKFTEVVKLIFTSHELENVPNALIDMQKNRVREQISMYYRVHIQDVEKAQSSPKKQNVWLSTTKTAQKSRTLSFWCFSPGYAMCDLISSGVRNILLTSGTLCPLQSFMSELQINFPITLQNPHIIGDHQVFVSVMPYTRNKIRLESTYKSRNDVNIVRGIGHSLIEIAQCSPNGMLVFFPSYGAMNSYITAWQDMDIMRQLDYVKPVTQEPRIKGELKDCMEKFYNDAKTTKGGAMLAVCRGKVSEGLDFANENGRTVVLLGPPFPPVKDPRVKLKMKILDAMKQEQSMPHLIRGQEWYKLQALRAVNQAIGRVIRHRFDYGAIIFLDYRYQGKEYATEFPKWIQGRVNVFNDFDQALRRLKSFFCSATQKEASRVKKLQGAAQLSSNLAEKQKPSVLAREAVKPQPATNVLSMYGGIKEKKIAVVAPMGSGVSMKIKKYNEFDDHIQSSSSTSNLSVFKCGGERRCADNSKTKNNKASLFEALDDDGQKLPKYGFAKSPAPLQPQSKTSMAQSIMMRKRKLDEQKSTNKKIKIIPSTFEPKLKDGETPENIENSPPEKAVPKYTTIEYKNKVKAELSSDMYAKFKTTSFDYTKTHDIAVLISRLKNIFFDDPKLRHLILAFRMFVKRNQRVEFEEQVKLFL